MYNLVHYRFQWGRGEIIKKSPLFEGEKGLAYIPNPRSYLIV